MRVFRGEVSIGLVNCRVPFEFEVEDNATEGEIEAIGFETAMESVEWGFSEIEEE